MALAILLAGCGGGGSGDIAGWKGVSGSDAEASVKDQGNGEALHAKIDEGWRKLADEGQVFSVSGTAQVQYGANSSWVQKTVGGTGICSNDFFGGDPLQFVVKACYAVDSPAPEPVAEGTRLASEGGKFTVAAATVVRYGAGSGWTEKTVSGTAACSNAFFGVDPAPYVVKACYAAASSQSPVAGDIVDSALNVVDTAYRAMAARLGRPEGIDYRYGPAAAGAVSGLPTWFKPANHDFISDGVGGDRPCNTGHCGTWQVGGPYTFGDPGGYSSNFGHVAFVPDDADARIGLAGVAISSVSNNVFSQQPELSWTLYGQGLDDVNALKWKTAGKATRWPVAVARCQGRPGWGMSSLAVFEGGLVVAAGSNTAHNMASAQLAPGKVPTGIAVTNSNEFALVTVWDTVNLRGELAVIALVGLADGATLAQPDSHPAPNDWWGEWREAYPGLANLGNIAYMKVIGYLPLPGMKAPTEVSVTTGKDRNSYAAAGAPGYTSPKDRTLSVEAHRQDVMPTGGGAYQWLAHAGVAVVISKSEQKAAFIDLKPLFSYYESMYLTTRARFEQTRAVGDGALWPFTFDAAPQQMPIVVKTVALGQRPTAVKAFAWGPVKRAWIATQDGQLHTWSLGGYPGAGTAAGIVRVASTAVGRNPTGIALPKEKAGNAIYADILDEVIVTSRAERKVQWVRFGAAGQGSVVRTLQDSRLVDPIASEDADNHSTESYVLSVADYAGRALRNYRYGPVIMHNYGVGCQGTGCGMGASGTDPFEYAGAFTLPGRAFQVSSANVP